jgi:hypothetical protein
MKITRALRRSYSVTLPLHLEVLLRTQTALSLKSSRRFFRRYLLQEIIVFRYMRKRAEL